MLTTNFAFFLTLVLAIKQRWITLRACTLFALYANVAFWQITVPTRLWLAGYFLASLLSSFFLCLSACLFLFSLLLPLPLVFFFALRLNLTLFRIEFWKPSLLRCAFRQTTQVTQNLTILKTEFVAMCISTNYTSITKSFNIYLSTLQYAPYFYWARLFNLSSISNLTCLHSSSLTNNPTLPHSLSSCSSVTSVHTALS